MDNNKGKEKKKANIDSGVIVGVCHIEDILCATNIKITDTTFVNALRTIQDSIIQSWTIDFGASFHDIPSRECFLSFSVGNIGKVYLGNKHAINIKGVGVVRVVMENGQELTLPKGKKAIPNKLVYM